MKGLLIKDIFTLTKQMKLFLGMLVFFSVIPGYSMAAFAVCYSAMLPVTALGYDERAKWNRLAATMPYSATDMALCKYVLGYLCVLAAGLMSLLGGIGYALIKNEAIGAELFTRLIPLLCVALILQAFNLPFMFLLGVEKGRGMFILFSMAIASAGLMLSSNSFMEKIGLLKIDGTLILIVGIAATVVLNLGSILLSVRIVRNSEA